MKSYFPHAPYLFIYYYVMENGLPFAIRPATQMDEKEIRQNINEVCAEDKYLHTDKFVSTDEWKSLLTKSVDLNNRRLLLVAVVKTKLVGHARLCPAWFGCRGHHVANLGIIVIKPWREIGIGSALLALLLEWAIQMDYLKASVEVIASNYRAINFFGKFGFIEEGRRFNHVKTKDGFRDEVLMSLDLNHAYSQKKSF